MAVISAPISETTQYFKRFFVTFKSSKIGIPLKSNLTIFTYVSRSKNFHLKGEISHSNNLIFRKPVTELSMLKNMNLSITKYRHAWNISLNILIKFILTNENKVGLPLILSP